MVRTLEQSGKARLGTRPASLRFSVYLKQIIDITTADICMAHMLLAYFKFAEQIIGFPNLLTNLKYATKYIQFSYFDQMLNNRYARDI